MGGYGYEGFGPIGLFDIDDLDELDDDLFGDFFGNLDNNPGYPTIPGTDIPRGKLTHIYTDEDQPKRHIVHFDTVETRLLPRTSDGRIQYETTETEVTTTYKLCPSGRLYFRSRKGTVTVTHVIKCFGHDHKSATRSVVIETPKKVTRSRRSYVPDEPMMVSLTGSIMGPFVVNSREDADALVDMIAARLGGQPKNTRDSGNLLEGPWFRPPAS